MNSVSLNFWPLRPAQSSTAPRCSWSMPYTKSIDDERNRSSSRERKVLDVTLGDLWELDVSRMGQELDSILYDMMYDLVRFVVITFKFVLKYLNDF